MKAQDLKNFNNPPNICLVGEAASGKTALASQTGDDSYLFDFDSGMRTALTLQDAFTPFRQATEFDIYVDENPAAPKVWAKAKGKLRELLQKPPRAIVVDSLTGMAQAVRLYVMHTQTGDSFKTPEIQHWGSMINETEQFLITLRSCKCLTIVTAHLGIAEMSSGGGSFIINSITKSHGKNKLAWMMDEVSYMTKRPIGGDKFSYWLTGHSASLPARTRSGIMKPLDITTIGLQGYLKQVGYDYEPKAEQKQSS